MQNAPTECRNVKKKTLEDIRIYRKKIPFELFIDQFTNEII